MPSLDQYLKEIRAHLPGDQADIIDELRGNLQSEIEDREAELERPLTAAEIDEILNRHGNPLVVAARYRPEQLSLSFGRQLIGPALFPAYLQVLTINFAITGLVILGAAVLVITGQPLGDAVRNMALAFLIQFGVVTGIFVAADRTITGSPSRSLDTRALPGTSRSMLDRIAEGLIGKDPGTVVPLRTSATDLAVAALFVGWLVAIRPPQEIGFLRSGPGWEAYYLPLILVVIASGIQPILTLLRPGWALLRSAARVLVDGALFGLFVASIRLGEWVVIADPGTALPGQRTAVVEINRFIGFSLTVAAIIALAQVLLELRRFVRLRSTRAAAGGLQAGAV